MRAADIWKERLAAAKVKSRMYNLGLPQVGNGARSHNGVLIVLSSTQLLLFLSCGSTLSFKMSVGIVHGSVGQPHKVSATLLTMHSVRRLP